MVNTIEETFDYNTSREKLILAEYGRNVQNMVEYIVALPTKEERNRYAQVVIDMMGFLNPHLRDVPDFKHKLWDHLQIISKFKIDIDSPYPTSITEEEVVKPDALGYPQKRIKYKHYGHTVELMIKKAKDINEPEKRAHMVNSIANFMKMAYVLWNKDHVADEQILNDLTTLSNGELDVSNVVLNKVEVKPPTNTSTNTGRSQKSSGGGRSTGGRQQNNNNNNKGRSRGYTSGGSGGGGGRRSN